VQVNKVKLGLETNISKLGYFARGGLEKETRFFNKSLNEHTTSLINKFETHFSQGRAGLTLVSNLRVIH